MSGRSRGRDQVFCSHCGMAIDRDASSCPYCGTRRSGDRDRSLFDRFESNGRVEDTVSIGDVTLPKNVAASLSYLLVFVSGIALYLMADEDDRFVRFHAAQSTVVFVGLAILSSVLTAVFSAGGLAFAVFGFISSGLVSLLGVGLWVYLLVTAYQGKRTEVPVAAAIAARLADGSGRSSHERERRTAESDPLAALRERYAHGEIDEAEFERRLEVLLEDERETGYGEREYESAGRSR